MTTSASLVAALLLASLATFPSVTIAQRSDPVTQDSPAYKPPSNFAAQVSRYMRERVRVTGFSGAVVVAHDGRPVFREGYGLADHEFNVANTPRTKFRLASVSKQFTAAAILLLEERGKLSIAEPVSKYLPEWPKAWDAVTLHHLVSHTSGLPHLTTQVLLDVSGFIRATPPPFRSIRDLHKPGEELQSLDFTPGEKFAYNNDGYVILGLVIESVAGKPYCDFMREQVFRPLGMTDTDCEDPSIVVKHRASGYTRVDTTITHAGYVDMRFAGGSGAIFSTLDDLLVWDRTLASDRLLSGQAREKLFTVVRDNYAYGWWVQTRFNRKIQWHRGNIHGFVAMIARYPGEKLFIAVLSNVDRTQVRAMATELAAIAFAEKYELPREHREIKGDPATYDAYVGTYMKDGEPEARFAIARDSSRLMYQVPGGPSLFELFPEGPLRFFAKWGEYYLTFVMDHKGRATHFLVRNEGVEEKWTKVP